MRYGIDFAANKDDPPNRPAGSDILIFANGLGECKKAAKAYGYEKKSYEAKQAKGVVNFTFTYGKRKTWIPDFQRANRGGAHYWAADLVKAWKRCHCAQFYRQKTVTQKACDISLGEPALM